MDTVLSLQLTPVCLACNSAPMQSGADWLLQGRLVLAEGGRPVACALKGTLFHFEKLSKEYLIFLTYLIRGFPTGQT